MNQFNAQLILDGNIPAGALVRGWRVAQRSRVSVEDFLQDTRNPMPVIVNVDSSANQSLVSIQSEL